ncbi:MAG: Asp-tRNA(Asn)/Glu-tRNA(Gln) amidotransferase subunit GatA [Planctomycetota bacterium]|jgi:aspartyl-tRNA(Asn)/glutamyl-tRNA(Gln) amidotransferase subunit A
MDYTKLSAVEIRQAVLDKKVTAKNVVEAHLARIDEFDSKVFSFISVDHEGALAQAEAVDNKISSGENVGKLAGIPVAIKDNLCIDGKVTTCASKILVNHKPPYTAEVVDRILAEDGIVIGKTNLDEFAMGSSTENSAVETTRNPWDLERIPGGSSGGSAAAVAAGFAPLALGSDTGGSIRQPASLCGCIGMKPTYGMVSRYGLVAFGSSLDQIGPFARTIEDAALLMDVVAGYDAKDSTSAEVDKPDFSAELKKDFSGLKIGIPEEYFGDGLEENVAEKVKAVISKLEEGGAEVKQISLPLTKYALPVYYIVATAEASSNLARYDGAHYGHRTDKEGDIISLFSNSREEGFGPEVKRRIMLGTYVLSAGYYDAYYLRALKVRTKITEDFEKVFKECDVIITPTSPTTAFKIGDKSDNPLAMYLSDIFTLSTNLAGIPGISIPCGKADNLPVGVQLMSPHFKDAEMLAIAGKIEKAIGVSNQVAPL